MLRTEDETAVPGTAEEDSAETGNVTDNVSGADDPDKD